MALLDQLWRWKLLDRTYRERSRKEEYCKRPTEERKSQMRGSCEKGIGDRLAFSNLKGKGYI